MANYQKEKNIIQLKSGAKKFSNISLLVGYSIAALLVDVSYCAKNAVINVTCNLPLAYRDFFFQIHQRENNHLCILVT